MIKPSTRAFLRAGRELPGYSLWDQVHGYVYARWPYLYIGVGLGKHPFSRLITPIWNHLERLLGWRHRNGQGGRGRRPRFADTYHGKVVPLDAATALITINTDLSLPDLEQVIPYSRARALVLENPSHIAVLRCPCRAARTKPCLPLDVCLIVGDPFASFTLEHHPDRARRISPEEAVAILRAEDERGHVHHAFFKDAMLGRFYAICNCCRCCCGAMQAHQHGTPMLASSGYVARVDHSLCIGCGTCAPHCQFGALEFSGGVCAVLQDRCMGCGVCTGKCTHHALSLHLDPARGTPLEIRTLLNEAARREHHTNVHS